MFLLSKISFQALEYPQNSHTAKLAHTILASLSSIHRISLRDLAIKAGVSPASVVRYIKNLECRDYKSFQFEIKEEWSEFLQELKKASAASAFLELSEESQHACIVLLEKMVQAEKIVLYASPYWQSLFEKTILMLRYLGKEVYLSFTMSQQNKKEALERLEAKDLFCILLPALHSRAGLYTVIEKDSVFAHSMNTKSPYAKIFIADIEIPVSMEIPQIFVNEKSEDFSALHSVAKLDKWLCVQLLKMI